MREFTLQEKRRIVELARFKEADLKKLDGLLIEIEQLEVKIEELEGGTREDAEERYQRNKDADQASWEKIERELEELADRGLEEVTQEESGSSTELSLPKKGLLPAERKAVLDAVRSNGEALLYAPEDLQNDREIVLAAVNRHGCALRSASRDLRNDKEVVLAAVKNDGKALQFASRRLKRDIEVVFTAKR